jgi:hypothetical protein
MYSPAELPAEQLPYPDLTSQTDKSGEQIDLDQPKETPDQIDLDAPGAAQIPDEKTATKRAIKAHFASGADSPGPEQLLNEIMSGNEDQLRQRLVIAKDTSLRQTKMDIIKNVAASKAQKGEQLTEGDVNFIAGMSQDQISNPKTILESEYSRQYFNQQATLRNGKNVLTDGDAKDPDNTHLEMDVATNIKTRQEVVKTGIEDLQRRWDQSSWSSAIANEVGRFIPLLENYRLHSSKGDSILPGTNLAGRVQTLWTLPPDQFQAQFEQDVKELEAQNPLTAMKYAKAVLSFSSSDQLLDNAFGILDASQLPYVGAGKLALKGVKALLRRPGEKALQSANEKILELRANDVKTALKDGVKADAAPEFKSLEDIIEASGDVGKAAEVSAYKDALKTFSGQDPLSESSRLRSSIPALFNIDRLLDGANNLGRESAQRLSNALQQNAADLLQAVTGTGRITRLEEGSDALKSAIDLTKERLKTAYPHLNDAILDMNHIRAEDTAAAVHGVEMQLGRSDKVAGIAPKETPVIHPPAGVEVSLGKPDATLFQDRQEADYWARSIYKLHPEAYMTKTKQQGLGYYISVRAPVSEVDDVTRDALISTRHETPKGVFNTFIGILRNPEDTLSVANRENRHIATHGAQELHRLAKGTADTIGTLPNKSINKLELMLQANRDESYMEGDRMVHGLFYKNVGELDTAWMARFGKAPSEQERAAYFSAVQLNDWDWMFRNLGLYRDKARQGIEKYSFGHKVTDETTGESAMVKSPFIEGRVVKDIPWQDAEDAGLYLYDGVNNKGTVFRKNVASDARTEAIDKIQTGGYKIVQLANPIDKDLKKIAGTDDVIHFAIVPDVDRVPLDWKQLPYRPGGHKEYQFGHWVKQPAIRTTEDGRNIYEGDTTIFNQATEAEAKKFAVAMDTARVMLKEGRLGDLEKFLPANLPYGTTEFRNLFEEKILANGTKVEPRLSLEHPIRHTVSSRNVIDAHPDIAAAYPNFENEIRSSYNLYGQIDKKYASQRDETALTVKERLGQNQPLFALEPSKLLDPLATMNRGLANVMRGRFLNDYKIQSVETFIQEFGDLLKVEGGKDEIRKNPIYYLHNAPWDTQTPHKDILAAGKNAQRAILNLLGTESELSLNVRWVQEDLMNFIYNKGGQGASDWVAEHLLPMTTDPFKYARGVAFHSKLGLFNPVQLFLQAQTLAHVTAVAGPQAGFKGMAAAGLMYRLSLTEDRKIIEAFAKKAESWGWKREHFTESYDAMKKSGVFNVEGEVALRDDTFEPKLFRGLVGKFLDKGTFFFREGERITRVTAWNAAYHEWRLANPEAIFDNAAMSKVLTRQNTLTVNMTRASNAAWQQGIMSVPTQFFAYQARLMEQFLGKRLTVAEKARAFTTYSALYGVPTAAGATTFAWPWYDDVRQAALERGYDVNSPFLRGMIEGIPSTMAQIITGNEQNYAQRLGPGGIQYFKDIFKDGKVSEIFGASPKIIMDMAGAVAPVFKAAMSAFVPGMGDWKFTSADAITALQEVSTINNVGKAIYAFNTGKFISKNEIDLGPATTADGMLALMMGTTPLKITDAFLTSDMTTEQSKMQRSVEKEIIKNYQRALREFDAGNDEAAGKYLNNVHLQIQGGGFRPEEVSKIVSKAIAGHESFLDKMNQKYIQSAPADRFWDRIYRVFRVRPAGAPNSKANEEN